MMIPKGVLHICGVLFLTCLLITEADAGSGKNKSHRHLTETQKDDVYEIFKDNINPSVNNVTENKFESMARCMKKGMWWNHAIPDCEPCTRCQNQQGCYLQCQGTLNKEILEKQIEATKVEEKSMLDKNTQEFWIYNGVLTFFLLLTIFALVHECRQRKKSSKKSSGQCKKRNDDLQKEINSLREELHEFKFNKAPTSDMTKTLSVPSSERDSLLREEDSGVSGSEETLPEKD